MQFILKHNNFYRIILCILQQCFPNSKIFIILLNKLYLKTKVLKGYKIYLQRLIM